MLPFVARHERFVAVIQPIGLPPNAIKGKITQIAFAANAFKIKRGALVRNDKE